MVTQAPHPSLSSKRACLLPIHGCYQRGGRLHKSRILDEFCAHCGYQRKAALRLLNRSLQRPPKRRPGPKPRYDPAVRLPPLKALWRASDPLCSKLLQAALPEWIPGCEPEHGPLAAKVRKQLLAISPAQSDRLLQPGPHPGNQATVAGATRPAQSLRLEENH